MGYVYGKGISSPTTFYLAQLFFIWYQMVRLCECLCHPSARIYPNGVGRKYITFEYNLRPSSLGTVSVTLLGAGAQVKSNEDKLVLYLIKRLSQATLKIHVHGH